MGYLVIGIYKQLNTSCLTPDTLQSAQLRFTRYYNLKYLHTGHVFEQRYKAFLCDNETYLLTLLCYIHQNPLRAHIPEAYLYPWSSHQAYCQSCSALVDYAFILDSLNSNRESAICQYLALVQAPLSNLQYKNQSPESCPQPSTKVEKLSNQTSWDNLLCLIASDEKINVF